MLYPSAYVAFKSWNADLGTKGWLHTGADHAERLLPVSAADDDGLPPTRLAYGLAFNTSLEAIREYGGIGSSGGPLVSGRSDHADFTMTRTLDQISPFLFEYCCSGEIFKEIYVIYVSGTGTDPNAFETDIEVRMTDAFITRYQLATSKSARTTFTAQGGSGGVAGADRLLQAGSAFGTKDNHSRLENISIVYTTIEMAIAGGSYRGWDTGADRKTAS